ncbi:MAG: NAD(P)H-hydrate epimerase, partial [Muribaculaceae bacterium]|nr:NAD(P)H-hydrate epimerase [Muribaculaceae bacterium]
YTIEVDGVSAIDLIEKVGEGVVAEVTSRWLPSKPVVIFAGPGNNGADALSAGRILFEKGFRPQIFLFNIGGDRLSKECRVCRDRIASLPGIDFTEVTNTFSLPDLMNSHLVIDGLFGSGLRDQLTGGFTSLVQYINESRATVISIDVPSGMFGDWNKDSIHRNVIHADITLAIQFPRPAFFLRENAELVGDWKILDIGLSQKAIATIMPTYYMIESHDVKRKLKRRHRFVSKNDLGSAAIIAGSYGMMGAAIFANKAAIRGGVGKVTAVSPRCGFNILQTAVPEAMFQADKHEIVISNIVLKNDFSAVAIGPGLGTHELTITAIDDFLASRNRPVIIDADDLNCIDNRPT